MLTTLLITVMVNTSIIPSYITHTLLSHSQNGIIISGTINGLKNNTVVYLYKIDSSGKALKIDSINAQNEKFIFNKIISDPELNYIKIDDKKIKYDFDLSQAVGVFLDTNNISISGNISDFSDGKINVIGSIAHIEFTDFNATMTQYNNKIIEAEALVRKERKNGDTALLKKARENVYRLVTEKKDYTSEWVDKHSNSFVAPYIIMQKWNDYDKALEKYLQLSPAIKKSRYGRELANKIEILRHVSIGKTFPNSELTDSNNNKLSLRNTISKNKLTIVEFWASWCGPCRAAFPSLKEIYDKYKNRGLGIIGYSVDRNENDWKKALQDDRLPWENVRETDFGYAKRTYGIEKLPTMYVVDSNGQVIAKDLADKEKIIAFIEKILSVEK